MYTGKHAHLRPLQPAFIMANSGETVTYAELEARSNRLAHLLRNRGLKRLDHYAIFMENNCRYLEACGAGERSGLYYTCVNSYLTASELAYIVANSESRILITSVAKLDVAGDVLRECPKVELCIVADGGGESERIVGLQQATAGLPKTPIPDDRHALFVGHDRPAERHTASATATGVAAGTAAAHLRLPAEALAVPRRHDLPDGSMSTVGDVGYVDSDGYLHLTDRATFMIITGGVNIYPQECENLLITHPKIADAAVFGVPNADLGEEVKAVVQPMPGIVPGPDLAQERILFCSQSLSRQKVPRSIDFEDELPRLPTGKLYKRLLRDRYWGDKTSRIL
jgi:acyl-CoA synthetase (AMP-forming)/AMP-acid ligase II